VIVLSHAMPAGTTSHRLSSAAATLDSPSPGLYSDPGGGAHLLEWPGAFLGQQRPPPPRKPLKAAPPAFLRLWPVGVGRPARGAPPLSPRRGRRDGPGRGRPCFFFSCAASCSCLPLRGVLSLLALCWRRGAPPAVAAAQALAFGWDPCANPSAFSF